MGDASGVPRLKRRVQVFYGLGVSYIIVEELFTRWVIYYYLPPQASSLRPLLPPLLIALALMASRAVDMVANPLIGYISDRTRSRWGRRIPFLAVGAVPLAIVTVGLFFPPVSEGSSRPTFLYLAALGVLFAILYTTVADPYNALIPEISKSRSDRLNLSTWQAVFRIVYVAAASSLPGVLILTLGGGNDELGLRATMVIMAVVAAAGVLTTAVTVKERTYSGGKESNEKLSGSFRRVLKNRSVRFYLLGLVCFFLGLNMFRAGLNYYVEDIMGYGAVGLSVAPGLMFGCTALSFYPINRLARRVGYKKPLLVFLAALAILSLLFTRLGRELPPWSGFAIFFLYGIPLGGAGFIFTPAILSEISAVESRRSGVEIQGFFLGLQGFFLKFAFFLAVALAPILLVMGGDGGVFAGLVDRTREVTSLGVYSTAYVSAASYLLAIVFYSGYREERA